MVKIIFVLIMVALAFSKPVYNINEYFPKNEGNIWEYRNSTNHFDTARINSNVSFAGTIVSSLSYSASEIEYFRCDSNGLYMVGQSNYLGTFQFVNPIGISNSIVSVGDNIESNWNVIMERYSIPIYWGNVIARIEDHQDSMIIQGKKYNDILIITVFLYAKAPIFYYLAKNIGIIKSDCALSERIQRELFKFQITPIKNNKEKNSLNKKVNLIDNKIVFFNQEKDALVDIFTLDGKKTISFSNYKKSNIDLKTLRLNNGSYIARIKTNNYKFRINFVICL